MYNCLNIAHRGANAYFPENTLLAFQKAIEMGVDGIELDVHLSNDGEIMVFHDEKIDRMSNSLGYVNQFSLEQLQSFQVGEVEKIPTLTEVFDLVNRQCLINIELKSYETAEKLVALIEHYVSEKNWKYADFIVSSFDWNALKVVSLLNTDIQLGILTATDLELALDFAVTTNAHAIHPHFSLLNKENCDVIRQKKLLIFTWTVNEVDEIKLVLGLGVDGIISDFPDRISTIKSF
jgi:glycerophosphoryl diester phosphodiesterase